jgi:alkanesulfonate monooxygenase SsuD/methylene tetrahydromethanopterin reductase-like flavin-dependent oxidoreductase (luciferase family)
VRFGLLSLGDHLADPVTGRVTTPGERHRSIVRQAVAAEASGFHSVHIGEHHFLDYIVSSPAVVLAAIAQATTTLRLSTGVALAANLDPLRIAEDYATVDALSDGRVEPCFGRGTFFPFVYDVFGHDASLSQQRFAESVELVMHVWRDEFATYEASFRPSLHDVTVHPRPVQQHVPVWIGAGTSNDSVDLAARLGCGLMLPTVFGSWDMFRPAVDRYLEQWERYAHPESQRRIGACTHCFVAPTGDVARNTWLPRYQHYLDAVSVWQFESHRRAGLRARPAPFLPAAQACSTIAVCGSPAEVVDRLGTMRDVLQLDTSLLMFDMGGMPEADVLGAIELTGREVLPQLA